MHTLTKFLAFIFVGTISYIAFSLYLHPEKHDDTIVYKPVQEQIYLQPMVENVATTSTELEIPKEEVIEETASPMVEEKPTVAEKIITPPPPKETPKQEVIIEKEISTLTFGEINLRTREALVNIFCRTEGPHAFITPISGSGTIIDGRGVILTNAHIAQFWLFEDFPKENFVDCLIRTGSPAKAMYRAELLYISPEWINENSKAISTENPKGTGEDDYALLLITEAVPNQTLPETFPYIPLDVRENMVVRGDSLLVAGYPAGFLGGKTLQQDLYASTAITETEELYTFDETGTLDLISLGGSVVAQQGASGGPAVDTYGRMIGLISTASDGETTDDRDLRATTLEHIERSLIENNNTSLSELLSGNLNKKAAAFNETTAPALLQILIKNF